MRKAHLVFAAGVLFGMAFFLQPILLLSTLVRQSELYSHIPLIPLVAVFFLLAARKEIFSEVMPARGLGSGLALVGIGALLTGHLFQESLGTVSFRGGELPNDFLSIAQTGLLCWVYGAFLFTYGRRSFREALFPLGFLLFIVPLPVFAADFLILALQHASAELSDALFTMLGASYHRNGLNFEFANLTVFVAEECSGIRSSMALFILSVLAGKLFLSGTRNRALLVVAAFPIAVVKNAFRIVLITLLANYVDLRFISSHWLHTMGGMPFFLVGLCLLVPIVWLLRKTESTPVVK